MFVFFFLHTASCGPSGYVRARVHAVQRCQTIWLQVGLSNLPLPLKVFCFTGVGTKFRLSEVFSKLGISNLQFISLTDSFLLPVLWVCKTLAEEFIFASQYAKLLHRLPDCP